MIKSEDLYLPKIGEHIIYNTASSGDVLGVCCGYSIRSPYEASNAHVRFDILIADPMTPEQKVNCRFLCDVRAATSDEVNSYFMLQCIPSTVKNRSDIIRSLLRMGFKRV